MAEQLAVFCHAGSEFQSLHRIDQRRELIANLYSAPERNVVLDRLGRLFWLGIIPSGVLVGAVPDSDVVVARQAFPRAGTMLLALLEILFLDRTWRKIMVPLDDNRFVAFSEYCVLPYRLHFSTPLERPLFCYRKHNEI